MLVPQLMLSIAVAVVVSGVALTTGWSPLGALAIYSMSGSLTLLMLATWGVIRADIPGEISPSR